VLIEDMEEVDDGVATTSRKVMEDAKEATASQVGGAVACGKEEAHL
jgi:hypothetical protein